MEYFVMTQDKRVMKPLLTNLEEKYFVTQEPFVTYANFDESTTLVDYFYHKKLFSYCFCVSNKLSDLLEIYADNYKATPFFITDMEQKNQVVYWKIELEEINCKIQNVKDSYYALWIDSKSIKDKYIFKVVFDKQEYVVVSLHLAENILRKNFWGITFVPVQLKKEANECY
ncbi:MAG: hypothetical protein AB9856_06955 [Cellulosilyticaceae bacterium]